jgi:PhnB protein
MAIEPHLWTQSLSSAVAWYRDVLGFEPSAWFPDESAPTWCQMRRGDVSLMIAAPPDPDQLADHQQYLRAVAPRLAAGGGPLSLYLHVDDVDAVHTSALAAGADIVEDIWDAWWGGRQFSVADPDGIWWTVFQASS